MENRVRDISIPQLYAQNIRKYRCRGRNTKLHRWRGEDNYFPGEWQLLTSRFDRLDRYGHAIVTVLYLLSPLQPLRNTRIGGLGESKFFCLPDPLLRPGFRHFSPQLSHLDF